jgi:hypothetical protein
LSLGLCLRRNQLVVGRFGRGEQGFGVSRPARGSDIKWLGGREAAVLLRKCAAFGSFASGSEFGSITFLSYL